MKDKTYILFFSSNDISKFREFTKIAERLKKHGRVQVNVSSQFDNAWFEVPEGGSPWHQYTCKHAALWKFFPHPKIAPFLPADWVKANQEFLQAKLAALRERGLEAFFWTSEPHFMPGAFFEKYPHLRGPRVDHPRRSKVEAFSMCADHPESLEMIEWMARELKKNVPELTGYLVNIDDAGSGVCWSNTLYPGANGPDACRHIGIGPRLRRLLETIRRGVGGDGDKLDLHLSGNMSRDQQEKIRPHFPSDAYLHDGHGHNTAQMAEINCGLELQFPIKGLINPLEIYAALERLNEPQVEKVFLDFRSHYDRGDESLEAIEKTVGMVEEYLAAPFPSGRMNRIRKLRQSAVEWSGEEKADEITEAFLAMEEAFKLCYAVAGRGRVLTPLYCGCAIRYITRPLVIKPDLLTPEEEAHFLPYIFNIHENEARNDYIDFTGTRMPQISYREGPDSITIDAVQQAIAMLRSALQIFENVKQGGQKDWFAHLATALRIRISILRSFHNFYCGQVIRDENAEILSGEPRIPEKTFTPLGDRGNLAWKRLMRDELDNTNELIRILENGGLAILATAKEAPYADMFFLEPDLVDSLKKKVKIMLDHWLDVEKYLASPMK
jgi:hypothetical protein